LDNVIFLDIDGVIAPIATPGHDAGMGPMQVDSLMRIMSLCPNARIVLSSAWRYMGFGWCSVYGQCMASLGAYAVVDRTIAALHLEPPGEPVARDVLIMDFVRAHGMRRWVAVDDAEEIERLPTGHWVRTMSAVGLTSLDSDRVISLLTR
jgi:hypothetical protein